MSPLSSSNTTLDHSSELASIRSRSREPQDLGFLIRELAGIAVSAPSWDDQGAARRIAELLDPGSSELRSALLDCLRISSDEVKVSALRNLGLLGEAGLPAISRIKRLLAKAEGEAVKSAAEEAIKNIYGSPE
jgi:hypothetical protein